jgi:hypothetical protein
MIQAARPDTIFTVSIISPVLSYYMAYDKHMARSYTNSKPTITACYFY